ncbi:CamS family sex pheromone protein [Pseudogracilibacillus sp. SO30301A]|uniref:CamS family sex pheromone protein n=1 Tax=Pseudogracilibacillus sp. SO30301A TaxID=3098291 RepID=UPI00300E2A0E
MKRLILLIGCALLLLSSCSNQSQEDIVQPEENEGETEISIIPNYSLSDDQYKMLLPYRPGPARGAITNQVTNRVDIDELEEGLRRHSTSVFDPKKYVFEEGQYLETEFIYELIDSLNPNVKEKKDEKEQIKEHRNNPRVFSHILEQNYLERKDNNTVELVGLSIGISLKSVYRFQTETGGDYYYEKIPKKEMEEEGKKIAQQVLEAIREQDKEELKKVPIMIALFREEEQSSPVPGNFVAKTLVGEGEHTIDKWETINEENVLFPSDQANEKYNEDHQKVKTFSEKIADYFPNYVGVAGRGLYIEKNLTQLSIEVPIEFYGKGEVIGFTQYVYGLVKEIFPNYYDIEVDITSSNGSESLIYRKAGEDEPNVHIYH